MAKGTRAIDKPDGNGRPPLLIAIGGAIALLVAVVGSAKGWLPTTVATALIAIGVACLFGPIPGPLLKRVAPTPAAPHGVDEFFWRGLVAKTDAGFWIGTAERLVIVTATLGQAPTLIVGWLAFKLASKWEAWKNVVQIPPKLEHVEERDWLLARHELGSWLLNRFWLGTLLNILVGIASASLATLAPGFLLRLR